MPLIVKHLHGFGHYELYLEPSAVKIIHRLTVCQHVAQVDIIASVVRYGLLHALNELSGGETKQTQSEMGVNDG